MKQPTKRKNSKNSILEFLLKYWIVIAGLTSGIFAFYQFIAVKPENTDEIKNIRSNYTQILDITSKIIAYKIDNKNSDSLNRQFEIYYGQFTPFKNDTIVFKNLRDFKLELLDYNAGRSDLEKLSYRQRALLTSINKQLIELQK